MFRPFLMPLFAVSALASLPPVTIDLARTGPAINPFIYGQFIEHLGRCIYGGIWAEMLEDRKFYFPVTAEYAPYRSLTDTAFPVVGASPWEILGPAAGVAMIREGAFVGEHSPRVAAGGGLRQRDLGVVAGREYVGYLWLRAAGAASAEIAVDLVWGDGAGDRAGERLVVGGAEYQRRTFRFRAGATTDRASLEVRVDGGDAVIGTLSLMPADNVKGMRSDTLALLRQLNGTIYRWPGGNFVSGYDWRDGIGDRDRRPPRKNPAWTGVEHNDFGTDEFIDFCRELGTEPMIAANTGFGDAYSAAQWVEYCNGGATTIGGGWRAANGSAAPFGVRYWCVGNEMFGPWQLGFMQLAHYTQKHNLVAEAMWRADPSLVLVGVGDIDKLNPEHDPEAARAKTTWSKGMLAESGHRMSLISEHFYEGRLPWAKQKARLPLEEHVPLMKRAIRHKAEAHRSLQASLPNLAGRIMPIAMDEWNYWHHEYLYGELGCVYDQADALGVAAGLHEYFRNTDIIHMAFYAQTVNVIGAIKTTRTAAEMETTGLVLQLYRERFGTVPVRVEGEFGGIDVSAALTADGRALTLGVVNPTLTEVVVPIRLGGAASAAGGVRWLIAASDERAYNTPGRPRAVDIVREPLPSGALSLRVPALGIALFELPLAR